MSAVVARTFVVGSSRTALNVGIAHKLVVTRLCSLCLEARKLVDNLGWNPMVGAERRCVALIRNNLLPQPLWSIHFHKRHDINVVG